jgi:hypothetical protein
MRLPVPQWLLNIAPFAESSGGQETAPARGKLRPSSEGSPLVAGDPCRTKRPSRHSFHFEIRTASRAKDYSGRMSAPEAEHAWPKRNAPRHRPEPSSVGVRHPSACVLGKRAAADVCPYAAPKEQQSETQSEHSRHFQTPCWTHNPNVPKVFPVLGTNRDSRS